MTNSLVRRGSGPMQPSQPQALQMARIEPTTASQLEAVTGAAITAFQGAADGSSIMAALNLAASINDLRILFDQPEIKERIIALQDTPLGFRTDRDPKVKRGKKNRQTGVWEEKFNTPYPYEIVKEAAIEALLRGLQLVGNQFNIISERFYCPKEGFEALIRRLAFVTDFRPVIGVPKTLSGGSVVDCRATWMQNGKSQSLEASIPVKSDDYSGVDQLVGKATRKFLKRCYECMTGNSIPEGDASELDGVAVLQAVPSASAALPAPTKTPAAPPAIAAAAAPVPTLTDAQQQQILAALEKQLSAVGCAAFTADACRAFGVEAFGEIPAENFSALMQSLADPAARKRWNRGCSHVDDEPILTAEQIAELSPPAPGEAEQKPALAPRSAAARATALAPEPAAAPAEEAEGDAAIQSQLM